MDQTMKTEKEHVPITSMRMKLFALTTLKNHTFSYLIQEKQLGHQFVSNSLQMK